MYLHLLKNGKVKIKKVKKYIMLPAALIVDGESIQVDQYVPTKNVLYFNWGALSKKPLKNLKDTTLKQKLKAWLKADCPLPDLKVFSNDKIKPLFKKGDKVIYKEYDGNKIYTIKTYNVLSNGTIRYNIKEDSYYTYQEEDLQPYINKHEIAQEVLA